MDSRVADVGSVGRRWWFRIVALVAFALLLGAMVSAEYDAQARGRHDLEARFALRGTTAASFIQSFTGSVLTRERTLAEKRLAGKTVTDAQFHEFLDAFEFGPTAFFDSTGHVLDIAPFKKSLIGVELASQYAHLRSAMHGRAAVSNVVPSAAKGIPVVALATPFDTPYGRRIVSGTYDVSSQPMGLYLSHLLPWATSAAYLVDATGAIVASSSKATGTLGAADPALAVAIAHNANGGYRPAHAEPFRFASSPVGGTPWLLVIAAPQGDILRPISSSARSLPWLFLLAFALTGGLLLTMFVRSREAHAVATRDARTDPLTGIANRRSIEESYLRLVSDRRALRPGVGVLMIDIDHFKLVNDRFGHDGGDHVLQEVIRRISGCLRADDHIGRWGGEEFVVLLPNADPTGVTIVAERIRACVAESLVAVKRDATEVTVSIGGVMSTAQDDLEGVVMHADIALYMAKQGGRDRCVVA